jgi:hypothetical protein
VAVILCNTGIALLAYMDGVSKSPILGGVVLAAAAAAGFAVYKVLFRRVIGDVTVAQAAIFFTANGLCSTLFLWPIAMALAFTGVGKEIWCLFVKSLFFQNVCLKSPAKPIAINPSFSLPNRLFFMLASEKINFFSHLNYFFSRWNYFFSRWKKSPDKQDLDM